MLNSSDGIVIETATVVAAVSQPNIFVLFAVTVRIRLQISAPVRRKNLLVYF